MNKTKTKLLWNALCACTFKAGVRAPYDCVCVHDKVVYATNSYVLHRVEGLFQPGSAFKALFSHSCAYIESTALLDRILSHNSEKDISNLCPFYDPSKLALALRPHKIADSKNMEFFSGCMGDHAPLILTSTVATSHDPIIITTAIQGMRKE